MSPAPTHFQFDELVRAVKALAPPATADHLELIARVDRIEAALTQLLTALADDGEDGE
jgi:hypothetical protein